MAAIHPPIDNLPDELFGTIFGHCVQLSLPTTSMDTKESPWLVSQVCSRWRRIALDTPSLWSKIEIEFYTLRAAYERKRTENDFTALAEFEAALSTYNMLLRSQLERSRGLPLNIGLSIDGAERETGILEEMARLISLHSHRIYQLDICDVKQALVGVMDTTGHRWELPALLHLDALLGEHNDSMTHDQPRRPSCSLLRSATNISTARIAYYVPYPTDMSWSQVTDLFIENSYVLDIYSILSSLTGLKNLTIALMNPGDDFSPHESHEPVILPSLEQTYCGTIDLLRLITAPNLQRFYPPLYRANDSEVDAIITFLARSRCSIDTLYIDSDSPSLLLTLSAGAIVRLLGATPNIRKLIWTYGNPLLNAEVIAALAEQSENGWFNYCPYLRDLSFNLAIAHPALIMDMIERRWNTGQRNAEDLEKGIRQGALQKVELLWSQSLQNDQHLNMRIERLKVEGLEMTAEQRVKWHCADLRSFTGWD